MKASRSAALLSFSKAPVKKSSHLVPHRARIAGAALLAAVALYIAATEGDLTNLHAGAVSAAIAAAFAIMSGRALFSASAIGALVALVMSIAFIKRERSDFILHAWDLFEPSQWGLPIAEIAGGQLGALIVLLLALFVMFALLPALWRYERPNVSRLYCAGAFFVFAGLGAVFADLKGEPRHMQYTWADRNLSSFYSSWPEAIEALRRGFLFEVGERKGAMARLDPAPVCKPNEKPPHIILIHQESVTPPISFANLAYDPALADLFKSHDGRIHKLRVETYGGGSWLTEFSVLTGMASRFFGGMQHFVQVYMAGRVDDALPATLARCGYRSVMFYPYLKGFFGSSRFFESAGLKEIFDVKAQKAPTSMEMDNFYYNNALEEIARHTQSSQKPLFIFVQTMGAHWPYDVTYWPERKVAGAPEAGAEMHEYLRRLAMSKEDYEGLRAALAQRFPGERFLIVQYGDHQPLATRQYFGFDNEEIEAINRILPEESPAFETYYAVDALNFTPPPLPQTQVLDAAYLGAVLFEQAQLPMPDSWRARLALMAHCDGHYAACKDRAAVLAFHRKLVDSGIVRAR